MLVEQGSSNEKCREVILAAFSCVCGIRARWKFRQDLQDEQDLRVRVTLFILSIV